MGFGAVKKSEKVFFFLFFFLKLSPSHYTLVCLGQPSTAIFLYFFFSFLSFPFLSIRFFLSFSLSVFECNSENETYSALENRPRMHLEFFAKSKFYFWHSRERERPKISKNPKRKYESHLYFIFYLTIYMFRQDCSILWTHLECYYFAQGSMLYLLRKFISQSFHFRHQRCTICISHCSILTLASVNQSRLTSKDSNYFFPRKTFTFSAPQLLIINVNLSIVSRLAN